MKIEQAFRIKGKQDSCTITTGQEIVTIGGILLEDSEVAEYLEKLRQVFAEKGLLANTGQEKA